jgi:prevent-host-death family protein
MDVGVRELKQHLSEYLRRVEQGETIRVTDRGVPKAVITPLEGPDRLQAGIDEGWVRAPVRRGPLGDGPRATARGRSAEVLREDRAE